MQLFETGLAELKQRQEELNSFFTSHSITKAEIQQKESQLLKEFEKNFKEVNKFIFCRQKALTCDDFVC